MNGFFPGGCRHWCCGFADRPFADAPAALSPEEAEREEPSSAAEESGVFLLTLEDGVVVIRQIGQKTPCRVYDFPETMLSDYGRALLGRGLVCSSPEEAETLAAVFVG